MVEFRYARGRIAESVQYISEEMREFEHDYANRSWMDYREDKKLQKLMDRTVENILTALIEVCGTVLVEEGIAIDNYGEVLNRCAALFSFSVEERLLLSKLALQRNRLAPRYLNFRWQAIETYVKTIGLIHRKDLFYYANGSEVDLCDAEGRLFVNTCWSLADADTFHREKAAMAFGATRLEVSAAAMRGA